MPELTSLAQSRKPHGRLRQESDIVGQVAILLLTVTTQLPALAYLPYIVQLATSLHDRHSGDQNPRVISILLLQQLNNRFHVPPASRHHIDNKDGRVLLLWEAVRQTIHVAISALGNHHIHRQRILSPKKTGEQRSDGASRIVYSNTKVDPASLQFVHLGHQRLHACGDAFPVQLEMPSGAGRVQGAYINAAGFPLNSKLLTVLGAGKEVSQEARPPMSQQSKDRDPGAGATL